MSLKARLVLVAAAAVATAVVLASIVVYFVVRNELFGPINTGLRSAASQIHFPPTIPSPGPKPNEFILGGPGFERGTGFPLPFRLVKSDGGKYFANDALSYSLEPLAVTAQERAVAAGKAKPFFFDTHIGGQDARIYTAEFQPGYAVQVAASIGAADHALSKITLWLIIVALGGTGLAAGAGFLVARSALRPVRRLRDTAEHVRMTRDLTRRIR